MYPYDNGIQQNLIQDQLKSMLAQTSQSTPKHVIKVNGRAGAESYNLQPNSDDILLDMNEPVIYFVQTDGAGYKTITSYDISLHKEVSQKDTLALMEERITKLEEEIRNGKSNFRTNNEKSKSGQHNNDAGSRSDAKG